MNEMQVSVPFDAIAGWFSPTGQVDAMTGQYADWSFKRGCVTNGGQYSNERHVVTCGTSFSSGVMVIAHNFSISLRSRFKEIVRNLLPAVWRRRARTR